MSLALRHHLQTHEREYRENIIRVDAAAAAA
jgi:hypothetical protein